MQSDRIRLFQTLPQACGYWKGRTAVNVVIDPSCTGIEAVYAAALTHGFRRAGNHVYKPRCPRCSDCVPCRVVLDRFSPDRSQRRCLARNGDITLVDADPGFTAERWALYQRYQQQRHPGGGMDDGSVEDFRHFLTAPWSSTRFLELRVGERLLAVAATDATPSSLSAVYTWYEPHERIRGLGILAILKQIAYGQAHGLEHLYLGYWIANHPKMHYKHQFRSLEILTDGGWVALPRQSTYARGHQRR